MPALKLGFEFQGQQHYADTMVFGLKEQYSGVSLLLSLSFPYSLRILPARDEQKRLACKRAGISLVEVPYWWDGSLESLAATVADQRPELVPPHLLGKGRAIPSEKPEKGRRRTRRKQQADNM